MLIFRCFGDTLLRQLRILPRHTGSEALWIITSSNTAQLHDCVDDCINGFVMNPKNWTQILGVVKSRIEVLMTKRRIFSPEFKVRVILELISGEKGLMQASREYGIKDTVLSRWKQEFLERATQIFEQPQNDHNDQERIAELERMVGRLTMQLDMAKKVLRYSGSTPKNSE